MAAGAFALHLHPRDEEGRETLAASHVEAAWRPSARACPGVPVGVSTGLWIAGDDPELRLRLVAEWGTLAEPARLRVGQPLRGGGGRRGRRPARGGRGRGGRAGAGADAELLASGELGGQLVRVLVEPQDAGRARRRCARRPPSTRRSTPAAWRASAFTTASEPATWDVIARGGRQRAQRASRARGLDDAARTGAAARGNAELVAAAVEMLARIERLPCETGGVRDREPGRGARRALGARAPARARGGGRAASRRPLPPLRAARRSGAPRRRRWRWSRPWRRSPAPTPARAGALP